MEKLEELNWKNINIKLKYIKILKDIYNKYEYQDNPDIKRLMDSLNTNIPITNAELKDILTNFTNDANGNLINKLWAAYYTYYYKDGSHPNVIFTGARGNQSDLSFNVGNLPITNNNLVNYNERTQYSNQNCSGR